MCLHTCSHHAARMTGCAELWPPFCVPTGSAGSPGTPSHRGRGCQVSQGPLSHPPSAQPPGSSLYNTEPTMVFLAHNLSRAPAAPVTKPGAREPGPPLRPVSGRSPSCHRCSPHGPWSASREPGPPLSSLRAEHLLSPLVSARTLECALGARPPSVQSSGRSPSFHRCSPHGLRPQTQSSTPTLQGSVCLSPCLPFFLSLFLVLGTLLEPSLLSPLWRTRFSALQLLLCPLHFFQGLQLQLDVKRAGPACPAQGCDPGTTTRPRVCGGSES